MISRLIIHLYDEYRLLINIHAAFNLFATGFRSNSLWTRSRLPGLILPNYFSFPYIWRLIPCPRRRTSKAGEYFDRKEKTLQRCFFFISKPPVLADAAFSRTLPPRSSCLLNIDYISCTDNIYKCLFIGIKILFGALFLIELRFFGNNPYVLRHTPHFMLLNRYFFVFHLNQQSVN